MFELFVFWKISIILQWQILVLFYMETCLSCKQINSLNYEVAQWYIIIHHGKCAIKYPFEVLFLLVLNYSGFPYTCLFISDLCHMLSLLEVRGSNKVHKVIDAYIHAVSARTPRLRYTVGSDAYFVLLLSYLPSRLVDWFLCRKYKDPNRPLPCKINDRNGVK